MRTSSNSRNPVAKSGASGDRLQVTRGPAGEVILSGEIDLFSARIMHDALERAARERLSTPLVVDLQLVTLLSASGVAELFEYADRRLMKISARTDSAVAKVLNVCGIAVVAAVEFLPGRDLRILGVRAAE